MNKQVDHARAHALIESYLGYCRFERVIDYLRRGRRFAGEKFYRLKFDWRDIYTRFDQIVGTESEWTHLHDLESELSLRRDTVPRPYPARHEHGLRREANAKRLWGDPGHWGETERCLYDAALLFAQSCRSAVKH